MSREVRLHPLNEMDVWTSKKIEYDTERLIRVPSGWVLKDLKSGNMVFIPYEDDYVYLEDYLSE